MDTAPDSSSLLKLIGCKFLILPALVRTNPGCLAWKAECVTLGHIEQSPWEWAARHHCQGCSLEFENYLLSVASLQNTNQWQLFFWLGMRKGESTQANEPGGMPWIFWKWSEEMHCYMVCYPSSQIHGGFCTSQECQVSGWKWFGGSGRETGLFYFHDYYGLWAHLFPCLPGGQRQCCFHFVLLGTMSSTGFSMQLNKDSWIEWLHKLTNIQFLLIAYKWENYIR